MNGVPTEIVGKINIILIFQKKLYKYALLGLLLCHFSCLLAKDTLSVEHGFELLRQNPQAAIAYSTRLYDFGQTIENDSIQLAAMSLKANAHRHLGELDMALNLHTELLHLREVTFGKNSLAVANTCHNIGNCYYDIESFTAALPYLQRCQKIREQHLHSPHPDLASLYNSLGNCKLQLGDFEEANQLIQQALDIQHLLHAPDSPRLIPYLVSRGNVLYKQQEWAQAVSFFQQALQIQLDNTGKWHPTTAILYSNIGNCKIELGAINTALATYEETLDILEASHFAVQDRQLAQAYQNIANCHQQLRDMEQATYYYQQANSFEFPFWRDKIHFNNQLALHYRSQGKLEAARGIYGEIIPLALQHDSTLAMGLYRNVASCLMEAFAMTSSKDLLDAAEYYLQEALNFYNQQLNSAKEKAACRSRLGDIALEKKDYIAAKKQYTTALNLQAEHHPIYAYKLGNLAQAQGDYQHALQHYTKALKKSNTIELELRIRLASAHGLRLRARTEQQTIFWQNAIQEYEAIVNLMDAQQATFQHLHSDLQLRNDFYEVYDGLVECNYALKNYERAFQYVEQSKADVLWQSLERKRLLPDSLWQRERFLNQQINYYQRQYWDAAWTNAPSDWRNKMRQVQLQKAQLQEQIKKDYPQLQLAKRTCSIDSLQQQLAPTHTLISYHLTNDHIFVFTLSKQRFQHYKLDKPSTFERDVIQFCNAIRTQDDFTELGEQLYQQLIVPLSDLGEDIQIVPSGILVYLPFEVLLTETPRYPQQFEAHPYLLRKHNISYAHSVSFSIDNWQDSNATKGLLAIAPTFDNDNRDLAILNSNVQEAKAITRLVAGKALIADAAKESSFQQECADYAILHLATHGVLNTRFPELSYLAFTELKDTLENEQLYLSEIYHLEVAANLVVLSACATQLGSRYKGEGLLSLARAFTSAGAKSIVASLWSIDDEQTKVLMRFFYEALQEGQPKHIALRHAKLDYLQQASRAKAHPHFWAACTLIGDTTALDLPNSTNFYWWLVLPFTFILWWFFKQKQN